MELQRALAIEEEEPELDRENITDVEELVSVCVGLVVVDQKTNIIRLVHHTTQEYFRQIRTQRFPNSRKIIAAACLTYLSFDVSAKKSKLENYQEGRHERFESHLQQNPFLEYAAHHWANHTRGDVKTEVADRMITLLMDECRVSNCYQVLLFTRKSPYFIYNDISKANEIHGIHLTALFGLKRYNIIVLRQRNGCRFERFLRPFAFNICVTTRTRKSCEITFGSRSCHRFNTI